jgi:large subunit ribosomal protein L19
LFSGKLKGHQFNRFSAQERTIMDVHYLVKPEANPKIPKFRAGDTVKVNYVIREGDRARSQAFQGVVIRKIGGTSASASFTVRRISHNDIGVERSFPLSSPHLDSLEILRRGKARRARLYYLRGRFGRAARIKERILSPSQRLGEAAVAAALQEAVAAKALMEKEAILAESTDLPEGESATEVTETVVAQTETADASETVEPAESISDATEVDKPSSS